MIGADDGAGVAAPFQKRGHAVAADVGHGADLPVAVAQHDDGFAGDGHRQIVTGVRQRLGPPGAEPFLREDVLLLLAEELGRGIDRLRHGAGLREGTGDIGAKLGGGGKGGVHGRTFAAERQQVSRETGAKKR